MKKIIFLSLLFTNLSYGSVFGPSTYEECVLDGLKNSKTESSTQLLRQTCRQKFKKENPSDVIKVCSLTWNGRDFYPGRPEKMEKYSMIRFKGTQDVLYIPSDIIDNLTQSFVLKYKNKIESVCPGINFDAQDSKK